MDQSEIRRIKVWYLFCGKCQYLGTNLTKSVKFWDWFYRYHEYLLPLSVFRRLWMRSRSSLRNILTKSGLLLYFKSNNIFLNLLMIDYSYSKVIIALTQLSSLPTISSCSSSHLNNEINKAVNFNENLCLTIDELCDVSVNNTWILLMWRVPCPGDDL